MPETKPELSVVVPVYYNSDTLEMMHKDLCETMKTHPEISYEVVFVDDGSGDNSWEIIQSLCRNNSNVRGIKLSRNFGSHAAILCGLANSSGSSAVVKAADLQEPSSLIPQMYESWKNGNNVVLAVRQGREDDKKSTFFANTYYGMTRRFALPNMPKGGFDIFLLDRRVINVLEKMEEPNSALTGQVLWSGFTTALVPYTRVARTVGKSRWTLRKKLKLITDTLFSFSFLPIKIVSTIGGVSFIGALIWALVVFFARIFGDIPVQGFTTLMIMQLFSFGIIMLTLGILGGYLWRTFDAARSRPVYIIEDTFAESSEKTEKNN